MKKEGVIRIRTSKKPQSRQNIQARLSGIVNTNRISKPINYHQPGEDVVGNSRKDMSALRKMKKPEGKHLLPIGYIGRIKKKLRQLRHRLGFGRIENLTSKQLSILNDRSYFPLNDQGSPQFEMKSFATKDCFSRVNFSTYDLN